MSTLTIESIESFEINGNYSYAPDFATTTVSYDDDKKVCTECAFCKRDITEYSYNVITDNKSLFNHNSIIIGKCGHIFHKDCMDKWIECGNMICPIDKVNWEAYRIADEYTSIPLIEAKPSKVPLAAPRYNKYKYNHKYNYNNYYNYSHKHNNSINQQNYSSSGF